MSGIIRHLFLLPVYKQIPHYPGLINNSSLSVVTPSKFDICHPFNLLITISAGFPTFEVLVHGWKTVLLRKLVTLLAVSSDLFGHIEGLKILTFLLASKMLYMIKSMTLRKIPTRPWNVLQTFIMSKVHSAPPGLGCMTFHLSAVYSAPYVFKFSLN